MLFLYLNYVKLVRIIKSFNSEISIIIFILEEINCYAGLKSNNLIFFKLNPPPPKYFINL